MKIFKFAMIAALCASSLSPMVATSAYAVPANGTTTAGMITTCAALIPNAGAVLNVDGSLVWSSAVVNVVEAEGAPVVTDTEVPGTRVPSGTPTYGGVSITGDPFRIGGSVNMFGDQVATTRTYPGSSYEYDRITSVTTNYSFGCELTEKTEFYTDPVIIPGRPVQGFYTNPSEPSGGGEGSGTPHGGGTGGNESCSGFDFEHEKWGQNIGACIFTKTGDAIPGSTTPGFWTRGPDVVVVYSGQAASQTDGTTEYGLTGFDPTPVTQMGNWFVGKVVVCISPSKTVKGGVPGAWQNHNGYTGTKCNTTWFNMAPWGGGSQDSNGTYISVPGV
jgi:hypothetical protein